MQEEEVVGETYGSVTSSYCISMFVELLLGLNPCLDLTTTSQISMYIAPHLSNHPMT